MRYIQVTHEYVLPVDESEVGDSSLDAVCNSGVSMMEAHMRGLFARPTEIRSDWKWMPREYQEGETRTQGKVPERLENPHLPPEYARALDSDEAKYAIEHDLDQGINFTRDVMGQNPGGPGHPWKQGLSIFPEDHPLREVEDRMRAQHDEEGLRLLQAKSPELKQIESGEDDA